MTTSKTGASDGVIAAGSWIVTRRHLKCWLHRGLRSKNKAARSRPARLDVASELAWPEPGLSSQRHATETSARYFWYVKFSVAICLNVSFACLLCIDAPYMLSRYVDH